MEHIAATELSLVGGALALDFANTAGGRDTPNFVDYLDSPADLLAWAVHAGVLEAGGAGQLTGSARGVNGAQLLLEAVDLRESIFRAGSAIAAGRSAPASDLAALRERAAAALAVAEIGPTAGGAYRFDFSRAPLEAALLGPIAWSALEVLGAGGFERLKQCPGHDCGWLFHDASKNNSRRWCDMATCGNRTKGRRHRQRH